MTAENSAVRKMFVEDSYLNSRKQTPLRTSRNTVNSAENSVQYKKTGTDALGIHSGRNAHEVARTQGEWYN